jgi:hypothetical protein
MPELPEVESLVRYLSERMLGRHVAGLELASIAALKTYDPSPTALGGAEVTGLGRRGKFLYVDCDGTFFALHLARAGWLRWYDELSPKPPRPGGPIALRLRSSTGGGFDATEAGHEEGPRRRTSSARSTRCRHRRPRVSTRWLRRSPVDALATMAEQPQQPGQGACCTTRSSSPASATPTPTRRCTWRGCRRSR